MSRIIIVVLVMTSIDLWAFGPAEVVERELVAMEIGSEISGSMGGFFFMVSGHIGEDEYFYFYRKTADGSMVRRQIQAYRAIIRESDGIPMVRYNKWEDRPWSSISGDFHSKVLFTIPRGSIIPSFDMMKDG